MRIFKTRTRARYAETDTSGIVYYGSYFLYSELGRLEMFRDLGLPYDYHLPIVDTRFQYRASARFDDVLEVHTTLDEVRRAGFRLGCKVYRVDGDDLVLLAEGYCAMVTVDEERRPRDLPEVYVRAFEGAR